MRPEGLATGAQFRWRVGVVFAAIDTEVPIGRRLPIAEALRTRDLVQTTGVSIINRIAARTVAHLATVKFLFVRPILGRANGQIRITHCLILD